jgi:YidC/Oxa1 family membrane protein insertase
MPRSVARWFRWSLCLALAVCASPLVGQDPPTPRAEAADQRWFVRDFGVPGEAGSYRVSFVTNGGCVYWVRLLDEFANPAARRAGLHPDTEFYELVQMVQSGIASFVLDEPGERRLPIEIATERWEHEDIPGGVRFTIDCTNGLVLEKLFRHEPGRRDFEVEIALRRTAAYTGQASELKLELRGATLANPEREHILGQNPAVGFGLAKNHDTGAEVTWVEHCDGKVNPPQLPPIASSSGRSFVDFAGTTNRFFGAFLSPENEAAARALWSVVMEKWPRSNFSSQPPIGHDWHSVPVALYRLNVPIPGAVGETRLSFRLYLGPKTPAVFNTRPEYERFDAVMDVDLSPQCFCSIPGARPMARFLLWILRGLHSLIGNWGFAIVVLTILVRTLMVPLNFRMQKSMRKYGAKMMRLKPQLDAIQKKHANDRKKLQLAMAEFQREHKMIPPLGGCLPMLLISFPVFIGLFTALRVAYELRNQPFLFYIQDLSQPDALFDTGWGFVPHFNLLPIIMVGLWMFLQMKTPLPEDPQQRQMMKIMRYMPLLFGVMLYNYAAGLMVYMITSSLYALVEQKVTRKLLGPPPTEGGAMQMPMI